MAKKRWHSLLCNDTLLVIALIFGISGVVAGVQSVEKPAEQKHLTELQKARAEILKLQLRLATKDKQIAECTTQLLTASAPVMEQEFLKQVGASAGSEWDWNAMAPKAPAGKP